MAATTLISEAEYLSTSYRPDCDFTGGELQERNLGQKDHSKLQTRLLLWIASRGAELGLAGFVEMRVRVGEGRYRVPDVCAVKLPEPDEQIFTSPPYLIVEVLSPGDTWKRLSERLDDYISMGVPNIWVLDPESRRGWYARQEGFIETGDGTLHSTDSAVSLPIADLFS